MSDLLEVLLASARTATTPGPAAAMTEPAAEPPAAEAFALLYRPERTGDRIEVLLGDPGTAGLLSELPTDHRGPGAPGEPRHDLLALIPYRQITERGFVCQDDQVPIRTLAVRRRGRVPLADALRRLPRTPVELCDARFDLEDEEYERIVRRVIEQEIGTGEGANFVIRRTFEGALPGF